MPVTVDVDYAPLADTSPLKVSTDKLLDECEVDVGGVEVEYEYDEDEETILEGIFVVLPSLKQRWKSIILAIVLFTLGIVFLVTAIVSFTMGNWGYGLSILFLSVICGLPGGYVCFIIYKVLRQDPDYDITEIPE